PGSGNRTVGPLGHADGHQEFSGGTASLRKHGRQRISVFEPDFHHLASESLRNFDGFRNAAAFSNKSRNVGAGGQINSALEPPDSHSNHNLVNPSHPLVSFCRHWGDLTSYSIRHSFAHARSSISV